MSDQTIFGGEAAPAPVADQAAAAPVANDGTAALLASITDDTGRQKYGSVEEALKGLGHAQRHISDLTTKVDEREAAINNLQTDLQSRQSVADVVESLRQQNSYEPPAQSQPAQPAAQGLSAQEAEQLFNQMLTDTQQKNARSQNEQAVRSALQEKFGDQAEKEYVNRAAALGLDVSDLNALSGTSPKAVLEYFGTSSQATSLDVSKGSVAPSLVMQEENADRRLERNVGKSVLSGSTHRDVQKEARIVRDLVNDVLEAGGSIDALTDPKEYMRVFGPKD